MGWFGKIIGGILGFYLGGPLGLIAGAVFGHMYDKEKDASKGNRGSDRNYFNPQDDQGYYFRNTGYSRSQMVFFVGAFSMLAKLASADGPVTPGARQKVEQFMVQDLRLSGQSYQYAQRIFNQALTQDISFQNLADQFAQNFRSSPQILTLMLDIFYRVAMEDGRLSQTETSLIDFAARSFRIPDSVTENIRRKYHVSGTSKAFAVLGLPETATDAEIKKAYRKLILEYHPDTIAAKGLADEFKDYATQRFREIQSAYETICRDRNIK